ncbi:MAG: T9SS type A sorting domain-containing protein [Chitinophagaceae bacterium]
MKNSIAIIFGALFLTLSANRAIAQIEVPSIDSFQMEIDSANLWYSSTSTNYNFSSRGIVYSLPNGFDYGSDALNNQMITDLLTNNNVGLASSPVEVFDTFYFIGSGNGYLISVYRHFICEKKPCAAIGFDGASFTNSTLYRIHEMDTFYAFNSPLGDEYWNDDNYYFAIADAGTNITNCLLYWTNRIDISAASAKIVQNGNGSKAMPQSSDQIAISPMPANAEFKMTIVPAKAISQNISLNLVDFNGVSIASKTVSLSELDKVKTLSWDVSTLPSGIYMVQARGAHINLMHKIVVAH